MAWYAVSYDLRREISKEDHDALYVALKSAVDYCWPLESFWIIETPLKPSEVMNVLIGHGILDDNDGIVVLEITGVGNFRRVVNEQTAEWMRNHITRL
jgi:hypothetical protein